MFRIRRIDDQMLSVIQTTEMAVRQISCESDFFQKLD